MRVTSDIERTYNSLNIQCNDTNPGSCVCVFQSFRVRISMNSMVQL